MNFKNANIIVITLFITLSVGIIGLLVTKYVYNLVNISSENFKYYKAYYIGYAGIELELLKLKNHGLGFEDKISNTSDTVIKNFTGINYYFSGKILSLNKNITNNPLALLFDDINCDDEKNYFFLKTGDAILLPLFYDKNEGEGKLSGTNYKLLSLGELTIFYKGYLVLNVRSDKINNFETLSTDISSENYDLSSFPLDVADKPYLIIGALENSSFCISSENKMVNVYSYIQSWGSYMNRKVLLSVPKYNKWANFTVYGIY